ncbi:MAG: hypothetical protein CMJ83_22970 [Planctomycetes bacterium]|nr:hypothetical protein [Planctomycetota bacterium]
MSEATGGRDDLDDALDARGDDLLRVAREVHVVEGDARLHLEAVHGDLIEEACSEVRAVLDLLIGLGREAGHEVRSQDRPRSRSA